jgi:hypothetical protein
MLISIKKYEKVKKKKIKKEKKKKENINSILHYSVTFRCRANWAIMQRKATHASVRVI